MAERPRTVYIPGMKHQHAYRDQNFRNQDQHQREQNQKSAGDARSTHADAHLNKINFVPPAAEVATRAYFNYVNQGSLPGRDMEHWLEAEAQLLEEHNLTRTHDYPNGK